MEQTKPGAWYFFVQCSNCGKEIIFQEAPPPQQIDTPKVRPLQVVCPHCKTDGKYRAAQVQRGQTYENNE